MPRCLKSFKQSIWFAAIIFALKINSGNGVLTDGATVTSDSVYVNNLDTGYSNCLGGLIDGKFLPKGVSTKCCATTYPLPTVQSWFKITMTSAYIFRTILIVNREDTAASEGLLAGNDFYVDGIACGAMPTASGTYSCGGLVGTELALKGNTGVVLTICQMRAYSYEANAYSNYALYSSNCILNCPAALRSLTGPLKLQYYGWSAELEFSAGPNSNSVYYAFFEVRFNVQRYIHAVTIIGEFRQGGYSQSMNWVLTVGSNTGANIISNTSYGTYNAASFDYTGKEIKVGALGQSVAVYRLNGQLSFRSLLIFSTMSDCSSVQLNWLGSKQDWPLKIALQTTQQVFQGLIFATAGDCAVVNQLDQVVGGFVYSAATQQATLTIGTSITQTAVGVHSISIKAVRQDGVKTPLSGTHTVAIEVFCATSIQFSPSTGQRFFTTGSQQQVKFLPLVTHQPSDAIVNYTISMTGAPSFVTASAQSGLILSQLTIDSSAVSGKYSFSVIITDTISTLTSTLAVTLYAVEPCKYAVISTTPTTISTISTTINVSNISSRTLAVTYDIQSEYSCTLVTTLTPSAAFISLSTNFLTIKVDAAQASVPTDIKMHTFTYLVQTSLYGATGPVQALSFIVEIKAIHTIQIGFSDPSPKTFFTTGTTSTVFDLPMFIAKSPLTASVNYQITLPAAPSFVTSTIESGTTPTQLNVSSSAVSGKYSFQVILTDTISTLTSTLAVTLYAVEPCKYAVITTTPTTLSDMEFTFLNGGFTGLSLTQALTFDYDIRTTYAQPCSLVGSLTPSSNFSSLSSDFTTITFKPNQMILPQDIGTHLFTWNIQTVLHGNNGPVISLNFNVKIGCVVDSLTITAQPSDQIYKLNQPLRALQFTFLQAYDCNLPYIYTHVVTKNGVSVPLPAFLLFDEASKTYSLSTSAVPDVGDYIVQLRAEIQQIDPSTGQNRAVKGSFKIQLLHDCVDTVMIDRTLRDMKAKYTVFDDSQTIFIDDTIAHAHGASRAQPYCYERDYNQQTTFSFINLVGDVVKLTANLPTFVGVYYWKVIIGLKHFPQIPPVTKVIKITIECEITQISSVLSIPTNLSNRIKIDPPEVQKFLITHYPSCLIDLQLIPEKPVPFVAFVNATTNEVHIETENLKDKGFYNFKLMAVPRPPNLYNYGFATQQSFRLELIDMCEQARFEYQMIPYIEILKQSPEYEQEQLLRYDTNWRYQPKTNLKLDCGPVLQKLYYKGTTKPAPSWIRLSPEGIKVNFKTITVAQRVDIDLVASLQDYPLVSMTTSFNVTLGDTSLSCIQSFSQEYDLGKPPFTFGIQFKNYTSFLYYTKLTTIIEPIAMDFLGTEIHMPKCFSYNREFNSFTVESSNFEDIGQYKIGLKMGYKEIKNSESICVKTIQVQYRPTFESSNPVTNQAILIGQPWKQQLPTYKDCFGQPAKMEVELGDAADFIKYDASQNILELSVEPQQLKAFKGQYEIALTLTDVKQSRKKIEFSIKLFHLQNEITQDSYSAVYVPPPKPFISSITNQGSLRVSFSRPIVLPTFALFPEFLMEDRMNHVCTNGGICQKSRVLETELDQETNEALQIVNRGLFLKNDKLQAVIELSLLPGSESSDSSKLTMKWNCTNITSIFIDFEVSFDNIEQVSNSDYKDKMQLKFNGKQYFKSSDQQEFDLEDSQLRKEIPRQISRQAGAQIAQTSGSIASTSKSVLNVNFVSNLVFGGTLSFLFSAMGKLQIMVHLLITSVNIPPNAQVYFSGLLKLVTYEIYDFEVFYRKWFNLTDTEDLNQNFVALGYHSVYFIINLSNMVFICLFILASLLFIAATSCLVSNRYVQIVRTKAKKLIMWNFVLGFLNEAYIIFALSCFMQIKHLHFKTHGEAFNSLLAFIAAAILVFTPFNNLRLLLKHKDRLDNKAFFEKYSEVYDTLNYKKNRTLPVLIEPTLSQLRILLMAFALIYLEKHCFFQIAINNMLVTFIIIHSKWFDVFTAFDYRFFQAFNECFVCIINYHMLCFADLVTDSATLNLIGYSAIFTITVNLTINFGFILVTNVKEVIKKFKTKYYNKKIARLKKSIAKKQIMQLQKEATRRQQLIDELTSFTIEPRVEDLNDSDSNTESLTDLISTLKQDQKESQVKLAELLTNIDKPFSCKETIKQLLRSFSVPQSGPDDAVFVRRKPPQVQLIDQGHEKLESFSVCEHSVNALLCKQEADPAEIKEFAAESEQRHDIELVLKKADPTVAPSPAGTSIEVAEVPGIPVGAHIDDILDYAYFNREYDDSINAYEVPDLPQPLQESQHEPSLAQMQQNFENKENEDRLISVKQPAVKMSRRLRLKLADIIKTKDLTLQNEKIMRVAQQEAKRKIKSKPGRK